MSDLIVSDVYIDVAPIEMDVEVQNRVVDKKHYNITISDVMGDVDENGVYQFPKNAGVFVGTGIKNMPRSALYYKFYKSGISEFHMPDLESIDYNGLSYCFYEGAVRVVDMPKLSRCDDYTMQDAFYYCPVEEENIFLNFMKYTLQKTIITNINEANILTRENLTFFSFFIKKIIPTIAAMPRININATKSQ